MRATANSPTQHSASRLTTRLTPSRNLAARYNIPNEYDKLMASIGSQGTNAYTSNDVTCYVENIPNNEIENWAKVQSDRFQNMVIRGFHTELEAVYEEKNISMASDDDKEYGCPLEAPHPYPPLRHTDYHRRAGAPSRTRSIINIQNYFHRYYVPNNVAICHGRRFRPRPDHRHHRQVLRFMEEERQPDTT